MFFAAVIGLAIAYVLITAFAYFMQDGMVYFPTREIAVTPRDMGLEYRDITFTTRDGKRISAWLIPSDKPKGTVLFCHGNAGNISHRLDSIRVFHMLHYNVLIFDYRGYGVSEGKPSEKGTYLDAEAAWNYLVGTERVRPDSIVLFGRSLGSAVAAELALRRTPGALIIESGFTSIPDLGRRFYPYLPVRLISRFRYGTIDKVDKIHVPKLFIHSRSDEIVPFDQGKRLFDRAADPKEFLVIQGGHNEGFLTSGRTYVEGLGKFLSRYIERRNGA